MNTGNLDAARNLFATDHVAHQAGFPDTYFRIANGKIAEQWQEADEWFK